MATGEIGRLADVKAITKLSRPTIDRLEAAGDFPRRIRLSRQSVGWDLGEVRRWLDGRPRGPKPAASLTAAQGSA